MGTNKVPVFHSHNNKLTPLTVNSNSHEPNFIYIGDGPTDILALSLTRTYGGYGVVVFNPQKDKESVKKHLKNMSADSRCDLITKADFSLKSDLFVAIQNRCNQILQKYEAEDFSIKN